VAWKKHKQHDKAQTLNLVDIYGSPFVIEYGKTATANAAWAGVGNAPHLQQQQQQQNNSKRMGDRQQEPMLPA